MFKLRVWHVKLGCEPKWDARLFTSHLGPSPQPHPFSKQMALSSQSSSHTTQTRWALHSQAGHIT